MTELGTRQIEERVLAYAAEAAEALQERGWNVVSSLRPGERSGILPAMREGVDTAEVQEALRRRNVACAVREAGCASTSTSTTTAPTSTGCSTACPPEAKPWACSKGGWRW
jgi:hypothetical protein